MGQPTNQTHSVVAAVFGVGFDLAAPLGFVQDKGNHTNIYPIVNGDTQVGAGTGGLAMYIGAGTADYVVTIGGS